MSSWLPTVALRSSLLQFGLTGRAVLATWRARSGGLSIALLGLVDAGLSFVCLTGKLSTTPAWFDGTLERNHHLLLHWSYTNNEQSRLLQFLVPEAFHRVLGLSV